MNAKRCAAGLAAGAVLCSGLITATPASADEVRVTACKTMTTYTAKNGAVKATGRATSCSEKTTWTAYGTLYDINDDSRKVEIVVRVLGSNGKTVASKRFENGKGNGTSKPWSLSVDKKYNRVKFHARACNSWGCGKWTGSETLHRYLN